MSQHSVKIDDKRRMRPQYANGADATGFWFAAAVLLAVAAAITIVYRTGANESYQTASRSIPLAAQTDPIAPPPIIR